MEEEDLVNSSPMPGKGNKKLSDSEIFKLVHSNSKNYSNQFFKGQSNKVHYNTGFGESKYDKGFNFETEFNEYDPEGSLMEHRAQTQPWEVKAANGLARATVKAATEVAKIPGVIGGIIASPFAEENHKLDTAFNNSWIKALDNINEAVNTEALPVYVKKAVKEGNIWDNLSSVDFWATDGADGVGFIAAMMVPGAIFEAAALGGKLINGAAKAAKFTGMLEKTETAVSSLKALGITGKSIDGALAVTGNTIFEAGAEAKGVGDSMDRQKQLSLQKYISLGLTEQQAEDRFNFENPNYAEQRATAMRDNFLFNTAVLIGPNAIMHKALWGKAGKTYEMAAEKGTKALIDRVGKSGSRIGQAFLSEGAFEEGLQTTSEKYFSDKGMKGELGTGFQKNDIGDFVNGYLDMATSTEGQKAMILGGVLGGVMTSYQGRKGDVENIKQTNSVIKHIENRFDSFNTKLDEEIYKKDKNGDFIFKKDAQGNPTSKREIDPKGVLNVAKSLNFTEQQSELLDQAIQSGDEKIVNQVKQKAIFDLILPSIYNGDMGMKVLEERLKSDSKFNEIVENDQFSDEKNGSKQFVKDVLDTAKYLKEQNEKFGDFSKDIIDLRDIDATKEQKDNFIDYLNKAYLNVKHISRQEKLNLEKLKTKRENLLSELKLPKELVTEDEVLVNAEKSNGLLKSINDDIRTSEAAIESYDNDIADIWGDKNITKKAFQDFVDEDNQETEDLSPENETAFEDVKNDIKSIETKEDLREYVKRLDNKYKDNPDIQLDIQDHYKFLDDVENNERELKEIEDLAKDKDNFEKDSISGTETASDTSETIKDKEVVSDQQTIQSSDVAEVDIYDDEITNNSNSYELNDKSLTMIQQLDEGKNQGSAKIISTNRSTSKPLKGLEDFVKYEQTPRDKTKDKVTFDYGDLNYGPKAIAAEKIIQKLKNGEKLTKEEIESLENNLPIKVTLSNGDLSASSFIEAMGGTSESIVAAETLPLRKAIVKELINNKGDFKGIQGKIEKQFPGLLKIDEAITDNSKYNNIVDLDVFKDMNDQEKLDYFKKNTVYVSNKGVVKYCATDLEDSSKTMKSSNKGEVFLKIPQLNGQMFYLKLNTARLSDDKASSVLQLIILKSNLLNQGLEMSFEDLKSHIEIHDLRDIEDEVNLIERNSDSIDQTLDRLINLIVYSQNTNAKTKLIVGDNGTLVLGELLHKVNAQIPEWSGQLESYTYTNETLNNLNEAQFNAIKDYLKYKRHNIIITDKSDSGSFTTFTNDEYVKYLLGMKSSYPILTTNAVINEPTFGGYANIYLSHSVSNSQVKTKKPEDTKPVTEAVDDTEAFLAELGVTYGDDLVTTITTSKKNEAIPDEVHEAFAEEMEDSRKENVELQQQNDKADIEKRRQEELNKFPTTLRLKKFNSEGENTELTDRQINSVEKAINQATGQGKDAKEIIAILNALGFVPNAGNETTSLLNYIQDRIDGKEKSEYKDIHGKLIDRINAKYDAELATLEGSNNHIGKEITANAPFNKGSVTGKVIDVVENKTKKGLYSITLDNGEKVSGNFETNKFTWVKKADVILVKPNNLLEIFNNADAKTKSKIVAVTAKQLNMLDKVNPKDMEKSFNELYPSLKENQSLQDNIKKICGI